MSKLRVQPSWCIVANFTISCCSNSSVSTTLQPSKGGRSCDSVLLSHDSVLLSHDPAGSSEGGPSCDSVLLHDSVLLSHDSVQLSHDPVGSTTIPGTDCNRHNTK